MPSRDPFETTIDTFSIASRVAGATSGCSSSSVMSSPSSDAAVRLRDAADLRGELRRALGEELVQLLDRDAGLLAERPYRRGGARLQITVAHEVDDEPV